MNTEILAPALRVINQLETEGLMCSYAIGGSFSLIYYGEAFVTDDLDIFCLIDSGTSLLKTGLGPIYKRLAELGFMPDGEGVRIHDIKVQFLESISDLCEESLLTAVPAEIEAVSTKIFGFEHALAMKAHSGRAKDWSHLAVAMESGEPNHEKLKDILIRYNLLEGWKRHELPLD